MKKIFLSLNIILVALTVSAQYFEIPLNGIRLADTTKRVRIGGAFAMQYQGLKQHADSTLVPLGTGINLPTANLTVDGYLAPGVVVNLTMYLSSRHHHDTWVKGGYLWLDEMPFFNSGVIDGIMHFVDIKIGDMELNYGDAHFRRSDNGDIIHNPFVGNYIMDAFTTAPALEVLIGKRIFLMGGLTTGQLDPDPVSFNPSTNTYTSYNASHELAVYGKIGFDKQITDDLKVRLAVSGYHNHKNSGGSLYFGDRTGSRFYLVMVPQTDSPNDVDASVNFTTGRFGPGQTNKLNSYMINLFTLCKGFEFFGTYESAKGNTAFSNENFKFTQLAGEGLYFFGKQDQFYLGARYDHVKKENANSVRRWETAAGWFLTKNIMAKAEYVNQRYNDFAIYGDKADFNGIMVEAGITF